VKNFEDWGSEPSPEAVKEQDFAMLRTLRDEIAEAYAFIFLPEWESHKHIDWRIERLLNLLCYGISLQLQDFEGWEETQQTIQEFNNLFPSQS